MGGPEKAEKAPQVGWDDLGFTGLETANTRPEDLGFTGLETANTRPALGKTLAGKRRFRAWSS